MTPLGMCLVGLSPDVASVCGKPAVAIELARGWWLCADHARAVIGRDRVHGVHPDHHRRRIAVMLTRMAPYVKVCSVEVVPDELVTFRIPIVRRAEPIVARALLVGDDAARLAAVAEALDYVEDRVINVAFMDVILAVQRHLDPEGDGARRPLWQQAFFLRPAEPDAFTAERPPAGRSSR